MKVIEFLRHLFLIGIVLLPICVSSRKTHATILDAYYNHPRGGIYKVDSSGEVSSVLSDSPTGLTFDGDGNLYYVTYGRYKGDLMMMSPDQQVTYLATIFDDPDSIYVKAWNIDVAVNSSGEVYYNHPRGGICKVDSFGEVSSVLPDSATGLTFDGDGNLYYVTYGRYKGDLMMMSPDQQVTYLATIFDDPDSIYVKAWNIDVATIPEPTTLSILTLGVLSLLRTRRA